MERDNGFKNKTMELEHFNSHAHVERDFEGIYTKFKTLDFNSHAHVERDAKSGSISIKTAISTHTLTWSVTIERN